MKHLKKLSVVLFATLLSFNFTSCIDDGVSDAVDEVYLAQAEYLRAQAALREAETQGALADAAYTNAQAAYELALAANQEALTAGIILANEGQAETNAYNAQVNINMLAEAAANLEVTLQEAQTALAEAQSAHEVAMLQLGEAVADAKNEILLDLYDDYSWTTGELQDLYSDKLDAEADLALRELMLIPLNGVADTDLVTYAYFQAMLEGELADLEGQLAAEQANLAGLQAITADDAADAAKSITDLETQIAALQVQYDALVIEHAESLLAVEHAFEAWEAETAKYEELESAEELLGLAIAAKKEHTDAMAQDTIDIAGYQENIDVNIPNAEGAITTAEGNVTTAEDAITTAEGLLGEETTPAPSAGDAALTGTTLYDVLWNTQLAEADALKAWDDAKFYYDDATYGIPLIAALEAFYSGAQDALDTYVPGTPIVDLENAVLLANAEEEAATAAWIADPAGVTWYDGTDMAANPWPLQTDLVGDHTDVETTSFVQVLTWMPAPSAPLRRIPATWDTVMIDAMPADAGLTTNHDYNARVWAGSEGISEANSLDANRVYFLEVEADDYSEFNWVRLQFARLDAQTAQSTLDIAVEGVETVEEDRDNALEALEAGYLALGYEYPADIGTADFSDIYAVEAYIDGLEVVYDDAVVTTGNAQGDVNDAEGDLGTEVLPAPVSGNPAIDPADTLYKELWNAELAVIDAEDALAALGTVAWNNEQIALEEADLEELAALLPSHDYAIAYLQEAFDALALEYNLDMTLWDLEGGHGLGDMLYNLPLFAEYLDAMAAYNAVNAEFSNIGAQIDDLEFMIDAYAYVQNGNFTDPSANVADFMEGISTAIGTSMDAIAALEEDIEIQTALVATGIVDMETAQAWVAEYQRRLDLINVEIEGFEAAAADLLARINALLG